MHSLSRLHLRPVIVPDKVQDRMDERSAPFLTYDLRTNDRVAELPREPVRNLVALVDRECQGVRGLVDSEVLSLQPLDLIRFDEVDAELTIVDAFGGEHLPGKHDRPLLVDLLPATVVDVDRDHQRLRCVPVSSAWRL
jgi:hypothetical protein